MKLIYRGKFDGNEEALPCRPHQPGAVRFREFEDMKKFSILINLAALLITVPLLVLIVLRCGKAHTFFSPWLLLGCILPVAALFPHELLHAVCFRDEVYLYTNFKQGTLFVVGPEIMSKRRFIFMSLLPNLIFGFIPYMLALIWPALGVLGIFGAISIGTGAGDYYNVFHALTQMPKGAKTYLYHAHSYWFMPGQEN